MTIKTLPFGRARLHGRSMLPLFPVLAILLFSNATATHSQISVNAEAQAVNTAAPTTESPENNTPKGVNVRITLSNLAPAGGTYLTLAWLGFHNGTFDSFNANSPAPQAIERIAEDGNPAFLAAAFSSSGAGLIDTVLDGIGPIAPGASVSKIVTLDAHSTLNRFFSYASMVLPSNDAFVANDDPKAYRIFDDAGNFVGPSILKLGSDVLDAGTEINNEIPANTPLLGQQMPNTGVTEGGVVSLHSGFKSPGQEGILDVPMFANANFKNADYPVLSIDPAQALVISRIQKDGRLFAEAQKEWTVRTISQFSQPLS